MYTQEQKNWAKAMLSRCEEKLCAVLPEIRKDYAYSTANGKYDDFETAPFGWTCGFFGGLLWLLYQQTGKESYKARAMQCAERLDQMLGDPESFSDLDSHDMGFMFIPTNVASYKLTGDLRARNRALHAAVLLSGRFNINGRYIRAWKKGIMSEENQGYAIIDCLMNLPLLYWAAEEYDDPRFAHIAKAYAETVRREFVRPDGSVHHIVEFDPQTGAVRGYPRGQGYASGTTWSRGQAWGIYGFTLSYKYTKDAALLEAAKGVADCVMKRIEPGKLPKLDYDQPSMPDYRDASAAAGMASGLMELAKYCGEEGKRYADFAFELLQSLVPHCDFSVENQAIVQNCSEKYHTNRHHIPLIYADYFLVEALMKCVAEQDPPMW